MITTRKAICFYCDGLRPVSPSGICLGCSFDVPRNAPVTIRRPDSCPKCTDGLRDGGELFEARKP